MTNAGVDEAHSAEINDALRHVDHTQKSNSKYRKLETVLADATGVPEPRIYVTFVSKPGNAGPRMTQSRRASGAALMVIVVLDPAHLEGTVATFRRFAPDHPSAASFIVLAHDSGNPDEDSWRIRWALQPERGVAEPILRLRERYGDFSIETYQPKVGPGATAASPKPAPGPALATVPLVLDPRVKRMLRVAIASSRAVMLVGPPGTGKSSLVAEVEQDLASDPKLYGLTRAHEISTVTADEGWTTRELVGGDSIDSENKLRFSPGHILQAISEDRWLAIDEANRADLDKIFGGLLTWLAGQEVTVGRLTPTSPHNVLLSWAPDVESSWPTGWQEQDYEPEEDLRFAAGTEWRLLGTYNSVDAHRVFRLGLALGRRFAQVPVPAPTPTLFEQMLSQRYADEDEGLEPEQDAIVRMYSAHLASEGAVLGPAPFLSMPGHLTAARDLAEGAEEVEMRAEAYLSAFGTWLCRLEAHELDTLGETMQDPTVLGAEWLWVREQLKSLA